MNKFIINVKDKKLKKYLEFVYSKKNKIKRELDREIFMMSNNVYSSRCNRNNDVYKRERKNWLKRIGF